MIKNLRKELLAISKDIKTLSEEVEKIIIAIEKLDKKELPKKKAQTKKIASIKPVTKRAAKSIVKHKKKAPIQMTQIHIPIKLERNIQNQIKKAYSKAVSSIGYDEQVYVFDKIDDIIEMFANSKTKWKTQLGYSSRFLISIYKDYFDYISADCPGWCNLDDDVCLECGENESTSINYERCKQRIHQWGQFGDKYLDEEKIDEVRASILAALFYLCNPYDVIPDFIPGTGFVDDAYVLNISIKVLYKRYRKLFNKYSKLLPR